MFATVHLVLKIKIVTLLSIGAIFALTACGDDESSGSSSDTSQSLQDTSNNESTATDTIASESVDQESSQTTEETNPTEESTTTAEENTVTEETSTTEETEACDAQCPSTSAVSPATNIATQVAQKFIIYAVDYDAELVVLKNVSAGDASITSAWRLCVRPSYKAITPNTVTVSAGAFVTLHTNASGTNTATDLYFTGINLSADNEVALYQSGSYGSPNQIEAFVSWGAGQASSRETVATSAGIWTVDQGITLSAGHTAFVVTGDVTKESGFTSIPALNTCFCD